MIRSTSLHSHVYVEASHLFEKDLSFEEISKKLKIELREVSKMFGVYCDFLLRTIRNGEISK